MILRKQVVLAGSLAVACFGATLHAESLFDPAAFQSWVIDRKARQVGDLITVQIYETSSASTSSDVTTRRRNSAEADLVAIGGRSRSPALSVASTFDGGGSTQRVNRVLTTLSVTVQEVLPNGDLRVAGEQLLVINGEQQKVEVLGRLRPADISDANVVLSSRLADARIRYAGDGDISERQREPWWRRLLLWMGL